MTSFSVVRRVVAWCLALGLLGTSLAACDAPPPDETVTTAETNLLRRGNVAEPGTLDPHRVALSSEVDILIDVFDGLAIPGPTGNAVPGAAESWIASDDKQTWTFTIRPHQWSDGVPVTAEDFVFGIRRALAPETAARYVDQIYMIRNAAAVNTGRMPPEALGVRAIDDATLEITLDHPVIDLPSTLMGIPGMYALPIPRHAVDAHGDAWVRPGTMVSNGAYTLADWRPNTFVRLERNPRYYAADEVAIEAVHYLPTEDLNTAFRSFRNGELDIQNRMIAQQYVAWQERLGGEAISHGTYTNLYIALNMRKPPFDTPDLRRAVALAIDTGRIADLRQLGEEPAVAFTPASVAYGGARPSVDYAEADMAARLEESAALLAANGFGPDTPLTFDLRYMPGNNDRVAIAVQAMLKPVGIAVTLSSREMKTHYQDIEAGNFEAALASWLADGNDPYSLLRYMHSETEAGNDSGYDNPAFDVLLDRAKQTLSADDRFDLLREAETMMLADIPLIPLLTPTIQVLVASRVEGYVPNPAGYNATRWLSLAGPSPTDGPIGAH